MRTLAKICWLLTILGVLVSFCACTSKNVDVSSEVEEASDAINENEVINTSNQDETAAIAPITVKTNETVILDGFAEITIEGYNFETNKEFNEAHWEIMQYNPLPEEGAGIYVFISVKNIGEENILQDPFGSRILNYSGPMPDFFLVDHNLAANPLNGSFYNVNGYLIDGGNGHAILPDGNALAQLYMDIPVSAESLLSGYYVIWEHNGIEYHWTLDGEIEKPFG